MRPTAWISFDSSLGEEYAPRLSVLIDPSQEEATFEDLDDAVLWAAARCRRIVVQVGARLSAGPDPVGDYPALRGEAAAQARRLVSSARERYAAERAAADGVVRRWYFAVSKPDIQDGLDVGEVRRAVEAHEAVHALHVRADDGAAPVWLIELDAVSRDDAFARGNDVFMGLLWPTDRVAAKHSNYISVGHGSQDAGLAVYLEDCWLLGGR